MTLSPPFSLLAEVYDSIMSDIDYEAWGNFMLTELSQRGWQQDSALDLGCGTGNSIFPFLARGVRVTGLDASAQMLELARAKLPPVRFVQADFTAFDLAEEFSLIYSVFDSLNNLLSNEAFAKMAHCVYRHLEPGGFFMFDINTTEGLRNLWESGRAEAWVDSVYYCWQHSFDEKKRLAKIEAYCEKAGKAFTEIHFERAYDGPEIREMLEQAGFSKIEMLSYPEAKPADADEARIWVIARKPQT